MWLDATPRAPCNTLATLVSIPNGAPGAVSTLREMRRLVREATVDPVQQCRERALSIIGDTGWVDQCRAIQHWVQSQIRYVRDPPDYELVQTPKTTLDYRAGDCDDQAVLVATLLYCTGHPVRFIAVGINGQPLSHVLCQTLIGQRWAGVETIIPRALGWMPAGVTSHYIVKV